jgi:hypothetical protein
LYTFKLLINTKVIKRQNIRTPTTIGDLKNKYLKINNHVLKLIYTCTIFNLQATSSSLNHPS